MLNGSSLNSATLNGGAGTAIVLASAAFIAGASFTADADHKFAASADLVLSTNSVFAATGTFYARTNWSSTASFNAETQLQRAGSANWSTDLVAAFLPLKVVPAEATWETTAIFTGIANAKLASNDWIVTAALTFEATHIKATEAAWTTTSTWLADDQFVDRGMEAVWSSTAQFFVEPTLTTGGVVYHEGYWLIDQDTSLTIPNNLIATYSDWAFVQAGADWNAPATLIQAAQGAWQYDSTFSAIGTKIQPAALDMAATATANPEATKITFGEATGLMATTTWTIDGDALLIGAASFIGTSTFLADNTLIGAMIGGWTYTTEFTGTATRQHMAIGQWAETSAMTITSIVNQAGIANWAAGGDSALASLGVLHLVPAPIGRQFIVDGSIRIFTVPSRVATFKVAV